MTSITRTPTLAPNDASRAAHPETSAASDTNPPTPFAITTARPFEPRTSNLRQPRQTAPAQSAELPPVTHAGSLAPSMAKKAGQIYTSRLSQDNTLSADAKSLARIVSPSSQGRLSEPPVRVSTFAVDGVQANDIIVIQRISPTLGKPNVVLYLPEKQGTSFQEFNDIAEMNNWLRQQLNAPGGLDRFASHFSNSISIERTGAAKNILAQFRDGDINGAAGPYGEEHDDIFDRLDDGMHGKPPADVDGLTHLGLLAESAAGQRTYSGQRPDGEKVIYKYDAYGNLHGASERGHYYFQKSALNHPHHPLVPLSAKQYGRAVVEAANDNVGMNDLDGLYREFIHHLENPAYGISDALQHAKIPKNVADAIERYGNNPIGSALVAINQASHNWFGRQLGKIVGKEIDEADMNRGLDALGATAQYFMPYYGRARFTAAIAAKALKGEPPTPDDLANLTVMFKGDTHSLTRPNDQAQPASGAPGTIEDGTTERPDENSAPPAKLADFATRLQPGDLASMHKGYKDIHTDKDGKQYVLIDDKVYRAKLSHANLDHAYLLDPETGEYTTLALDYGKGAWRIDDSPRLKGGNPNLVRYFSPKYRQARRQLEGVIHGPRNADQLSDAQKASFSESLNKLVRESKADELNPPELRHAIDDYVDKDVHGVRQFLLERPTMSDQQLLSDPGVPAYVKHFLQAVEKLPEYQGNAYRNTRITPEAAERLRGGIGRVFIDSRVQSASIASFNAFGWESWSKDNAMPGGTQKTILVFDKSIEKKNISNDQLSNHVVIPRNTWLKVLATKDDGDTLFVYLGDTSKTPDHVYSLHDGSQLL
jgi:hypothetical protein